MTPFAPAILVSIAVVGASVPAHADHHPALVVPGTPGVPVIVDGVDASYGVVEGDWGLHRPGAGVRTVYPSYWVEPVRGGGYFPMTGRPPAYGRLEVDPRRHERPRRAQSYYRSWTAGSTAAPVWPAPGAESLPEQFGDPRRNAQSTERWRHRPARRHVHRASGNPRTGVHR